MDLSFAILRNSTQNSGSRETDVRCPFKVTECFSGRRLIRRLRTAQSGRLFGDGFGSPASDRSDGLSSFRPDHLFGFNGFIKGPPVDESQPDRLLPEGGSVPVRRLGHSRGIVVADTRSKGRHQHQ